MNEIPDPGDRLEIPATAVKCVDESNYPLIVLVRLTDAGGRQHDIIDKDVAFGGDIGLTTEYPAPVTVPCEVLDVTDGIALVRLVWCETEEGLTEVRVPAAALVRPS
ncbi:hypothetical protein [Kutzneria sp. NPDC052558]|uniref:hypothetical protein n=1 Tax=Kutzneria sp. NPDC052558 TaxID=3364121 RepID=UPI0037C52747